MERIAATYRIETPLDIEQAAAVLASEQSSGTFTRVPGETDELRQRFAARVEHVEPLEMVEQPSLPGCRATGRLFRRAAVTISWSLENVGYNLPTLVSTLQGNLYELSQFSGLKLLDFEVPGSYATCFKGPRFGVEGTRRLTNVFDRPLVGTIIKPSVGLSPEQTAELVAILAAAGVDFIKDDELMANPPHSPFDERVAAVMRVIDQHAERTGKRVMVAFNVTDELDAMLGHYDRIVEAGGTCAMVSLNSVGLVAVEKLCEQGKLVIHGHRNGWGMLSRHPMLGIEFEAYQKLWRLAGVDQIHVNGIDNKFCEPDDSVVRSIDACRRPFLGGFGILPVISSGQWGGQAFATYEYARTADLLYLAGGGILAHPDGPAAGVEAIGQAWRAAIDGLSLEQAAATFPEFAQAVAKFGGKRIDREQHDGG